ncbi:MAG: PAS domain-containing sensor histidine kinase [Jatrophihabitantaceae bacterium]
MSHLEASVEVCSDAAMRLDLDGRVVAWNRAAARILGSRSKLASGAPFIDAIVDRDGWPVLLARAINGERTEGFHIEVQQGNGRNIPVVIALVPLRDERDRTVGLSLVLRDLSEQVFAQQTLAESERRVTRAEALALTGSFVVDVHGSAQWSAGMYRIHGTDPAQFTVTLADHLGLVLEQDRGRVSKALEHAMSGEVPPGVDHRVRHTDGTVTWVFMAVEPRLDARGQILGVSGVCQDITARMASETALHDALRREQAVSDELRRVDALKDEFLATVSHELRTPLTSIAGFAALLRQAAPERADLVEPIERNAGEMHRLIQHLLDQARLESGRVILEPTQFVLADAVRSVVANTATLLGQTTVFVDIAPDITVVMDVDGFGHILRNLLGNAAKHAGGATIVVSAQVTDGTVIVSVADEGPGIAPEHQEHLFDPFFQVPGEYRSVRGTGLGLAIVRRYVELQGGKVWCESTFGSGATFYFTIPTPQSDSP